LVVRERDRGLFLSGCSPNRRDTKAITAYLGHASFQTTFDLYGHVMPGNEDEAIALVDAYLQGADTRWRRGAIDASDLRRYERHGYLSRD
jgi:hypothetical protein